MAWKLGASNKMESGPCEVPFYSLQAKKLLAMPLPATLHSMLSGRALTRPPAQLFSQQRCRRRTRVARTEPPCCVPPRADSQARARLPRAGPQEGQKWTYGPVGTPWTRWNPRRRMTRDESIRRQHWMPSAESPNTGLGCAGEVRSPGSRLHDLHETVLREVEQARLCPYLTQQ